MKNHRDRSAAVVTASSPHSTRQGVRPMADDSVIDGAAFARLVGSRYSCRAFCPDQVPRETIDAMIGLAGRAASWCNVQPWTLHLLQGNRLETLRAELSQRQPNGQTDIPFPPGYEGRFRERRRRAGFQLYEAVGIPRDDMAGRAAQSARNFIFFDAPHLAILTTAADIGPYALVDCGGFLAHFLLAARALGVDSIPQAALAQHSTYLRQFLGLDDDQQIICGISFGYAIDDHPANSYRTDRAAPQEFVKWH